MNVNESMQFLINNIIQRMEAVQSKGGGVFSAERKNVNLDPVKHNESGQKRKQKKDCC